MNLATESSELSAEDIIDERRECNPIPNGVWEETVLVNFSSSIWPLKYHWMLIPTAPIWGSQFTSLEKKKKRTEGLALYEAKYEKTYIPT